MKTDRVPDARLLGNDGVNVPDVVAEVVPAAREPDTDGVHELEPRALIVIDGEPDGDPEKEDDPEKDAEPVIHEADCDVDCVLDTDGDRVTETEGVAERERVPDGELERDVVMREDVLAVRDSTTHVELDSLQTPLAQSLSCVHVPFSFELRRRIKCCSKSLEAAGRSSGTAAPPWAGRASGGACGGGTAPGEAASPLMLGSRPTSRAGTGAASGNDGRSRRERRRRRNARRILKNGGGG